jgi:hypothetical protein
VCELVVEVVHTPYVRYDGRAMTLLRKSDIRKISVTGEARSYFVTLPKDEVEALRWRKGEIGDVD